MLPRDYVVPVVTTASSTQATVVGLVRVRLEDQLPNFTGILRFVVLPPGTVPAAACP